MSDPIERLVRAVNLLEIAEDQILEARTELLMIGAVESAAELKMLRTHLKKLLGELRMRTINNLDPINENA